MSMNIWEEPYYSEKYGQETKASFKYFTQLQQRGYPYNMREMAEDLVVNNETKINNIKEKIKKKSRKDKTLNYDDEYEKEVNAAVKRQYNTLMNYSCKWKYTKRLDAYDEHLKQLHFKTKEKEVMEWESEQLKLAKQRAKLHSDTLNKIHKADEDLFPLTKKAYAEETNERAYNESIDAVYKLLHGGVIKQENRTKTDMNLDADVKQEIKEHKTIEEKNKENDEYFKQLERDMAEE